MSPKLEDKIGMKLETFTFKVEQGKNLELAKAIGDPHPDYQDGTSLLPTFPTVIEFWGSKVSNGAALGLNMLKVLHGEQEYEYLGKIRPGDEITVTGVVEDAYTKGTMNMMVVKKEYVNQEDKLVLIARSTIIERH
ncbi:FAS1-like dehydratase domain-containing protein [Bacillus sp. JJ722]|uniref:FAS1-like dehydratase domain-containing protein n=1 Tax=Bacillus sp. JJ722 TaxID=3122973 RepID=UPI002FFEE926